VLVVVLAWQRRQVAPPGGDATLRTVEGTAPPTTGAASDSRAYAPAEAPGGARAAPEDALGAIDPKAAWRAQAWRAVLPVVTERLGRAPTPDEQRRLLDVLASVGPAARSLDREMLDPDDPGSIARVREQTRVLVEADQTCRALLGIGVAELLRRLDPQSIEDQGGSEP
jgi:hypothetical protein